MDNGFTVKEIMFNRLSFSVDVVPAPKNLVFSDVTQTSFTASWEHGAPDVALFRIGYSKSGEDDFKYVSKKPSCPTVKDF